MKISDKILKRIIKEDRFLPYVDVKSVEEYFSLPKEKREKYGLYLMPFSLPLEIDEMASGGETSFKRFYKEIRRCYPIQWFFREYLFDVDNPVYYWAWFKPYHRMRDTYHNIRRFIRPEHPRFRKVYRRYEYRDLVEVIPETLFAMIQDFWYEEVLNGYVDWHSDESHQEVYDFLKNAVEWTEKIRPEIDKKIREEYSAVKNKRGKTYDEKYGEINRLEKLIFDKETEILKKLLDYRERMWT